MERIIVSACLLGEPCRYDGVSHPCDALKALSETYDLVPVCPEQLGGLPTPRTPSEIQPDGRVVNRDGVDVSKQFRLGALRALDIARTYSCTHSILKAKSPSCGPHKVYDGSFSGKLVSGRGIAAAILADAGLVVEDELEASRRLQQ